LRVKWIGPSQPHLVAFPKNVNKYFLPLSQKVKHKRAEQQLNVQKAERFRIIGVFLGLLQGD